MATTIRTLEISGAPYERGMQYGRGASDLIAASRAYYQEALRQQLGLEWPEVRELAKPWLPLCREHAPEIVEELQGIADGSGLDLLDLLALNVRGEIIYDLGGRTAVEADDERESADGCTSFSLTDGAAGDGHVYVGQNWDWRAGTAGTLLVLRIVQDPLPTIIMQVEAGQVGRHGANSAGIALNANGLGGRFGGAARGMPQTFIRRMVLDQSELADAVNTLVRTPAHIASNALLTVREGFSISLEITPAGIDWLYPDGGLLVHGNHYAGSIPPAIAGRYRPVSADSLFRVPQATRGLRRAREAVTTDDVRETVHRAMSDHLGYPESVCTHPDERRPFARRWTTLLLSCVDLTTGDYLVAAGNPCSAPLERMAWNLYDGPGSRHTLTTRIPMESIS